MKPIAHIRTDMPQKFGIPRNSFLAPHLQGTIVFEPEFALNSAVEGMEGFTYLWLIWEFENGTPGGTAADIANDAQTDDKRGTTEKWFPTVRPPRLGGTKRMGVFATRSPFRPNPIGLTCVKLERIELTENGPLIHVLGADLRDGTPTFPLPTATPTHKAALSTERLGKNSLFTAPPNCCNPFPKKNVKAFLRYWSRTRVAQAVSTNLSVRTILPMQGLILPLPLMAQTFTFKTSNQSSPKA